MKDYYDRLEVSPGARTSVISAAFKVLMAENHPDKTGNDNIAKELGEAYATLKNRRSRKKYDRDRLKQHGTIIGDYRVLEQIAEGGFGITYKGEHTSLGTPVCIKHASSISLQDEEILMEEARAIWDLRHFAIPTIRNILKLEDGSVALVMSYVPGPTLYEIIETNLRLSPEHVCWITDRMLNALKYLHFHGVIHGDVKPGNVIIQPDSHMVVLVDYGLSLIRPSRKSKSKGYTPMFASPEQERGLSLLPESDLYSLGMTMMFALGGDLKRKEVPADVPDSLCRFIKRLIAYNMLSRPRWDKDDLIKELRDIRMKEFGRSSSFGMKIPEF